jgi:hypothetical protein
VTHGVARSPHIGQAVLEPQTFPPALEIVDSDDMCVLQDDDLPADWRYVFLGSAAL